MTTQRRLEPHPFTPYAEAVHICSHCDGGEFASCHQETEIKAMTHITWDEGAGTEITFALGQRTIKTLCGARVSQRGVNNLAPTCESCREIRQHNVEADAQLLRDLAPIIKRLGLKV